MASFLIEGGRQLHGAITPQGAKNEILQILCATLLTTEPVTVHNIPDILDVNNLMKMMTAMGSRIENLGGGSFRITNVFAGEISSSPPLRLKIKS